MESNEASKTLSEQSIVPDNVSLNSPEQSNGPDSKNKTVSMDAIDDVSTPDLPIQSTVSNISEVNIENANQECTAFPVEKDVSEPTEASPKEVVDSNSPPKEVVNVPVEKDVSEPTEASPKEVVDSNSPPQEVVNVPVEKNVSEPTEASPKEVVNVPVEKNVSELTEASPKEVENYPLEKDVSEPTDASPKELVDSSMEKDVSENTEDFTTSNVNNLVASSSLENQQLNKESIISSDKLTDKENDESLSAAIGAGNTCSEDQQDQINIESVSVEKAVDKVLAIASDSVEVTETNHKVCEESTSGDGKTSQKDSEVSPTSTRENKNILEVSPPPVEVEDSSSEVISDEPNKDKECSEQIEAMEVDDVANAELIETDNSNLEKPKFQNTNVDSSKVGSVSESVTEQNQDKITEPANKGVEAEKCPETSDNRNEVFVQNVAAGGDAESSATEPKEFEALKEKLNTDIQDTDPIVLYEMTKDSKRRAREIAGEFQMELASVEISSRIAAMKEQYHLEDLGKDQKVAECSQCKVTKPLLYKVPDLKYQTLVCSLFCGMRTKLAAIHRNSIDLRRRLCPMCSFVVIPGEENFSWKTRIYCSSRCLSRQIKQASDICAQCKTNIDLPIVGTYCLLRGKTMKLFCSASCRALHKLKTLYCAICYGPHEKADCYDVIGEKYSICSEQCKKDADFHQKTSEPVKCEVCKVVKQAQYHLMMKHGLKYLCSEKCFKAFTFVGHYDMVQCMVCELFFDKLQQRGSVLCFINEVDYNFCSRFCHFLFLKENVIKKRCNWCRLEKTGTSMVRRVLGGGMECFYCNPHCLHMLSGQKIERLKAQKCDVCQTFSQEQYHVPIYSSTATFCSLKCVHIYHNSVLNGNPVIPVEESSEQNEEEPLEPLDSATSKKSDQGTQAEPENTVSVMTNTIRQLLIKPDEKKSMRNIATGVIPVTKSKRVSCRTLSVCTGAQTGEELERPLCVPVPMPLFVPTPAACESFPFPVPVPIPIPVPIPVFVPTHRNSVAGIMKEIKKIREEIPENPLEAEILMLAKALPSERDDSSPPPEPIKQEPPPSLPTTNMPANISVNNTTANSNVSSVAPVERVTVERVEVVPVQAAAPVAVAHVPPPAPAPNPAPAPEANSSFDIVQMAISMACSDYETPSHGVQYTELQQAAQPASITSMNTTIDNNHGVIVSQDMMKSNSGNKRSYPSNDPGVTSAKQARHSTTSYNTEPAQVASASFASYQPAVFGLDKPDANMYLKYTLGVNAWRQWAVGKNLELSRAAYANGNRTITPKLFKPDILQLTQDELVLSLCLFVKEARRPDGTPFSPDVIYYFCLGIQQYLFESGWRGNIFTDPQFETFTCLLDEVCASYHVLHHNISQVEEEHLWESKQLGAHNPHVLLHTLLYFNTKHFLLSSVEEHSHLLFGQIMEHKAIVGGAKNPRNQQTDVFLRYSPKTSDGREKHVLIQKENKADRLRCPVKLYEFYLTKCPLNVNRHDGRFYLMPEKSCRFDSPVWFSNTPLGEDSLRKMLNRIKIIKEISLAPHTSGMPLNYR